MRLSDEFLGGIGLGLLARESVDALRKYCSSRFDLHVESLLKATLSAEDYEIYSAFFRNDDFAGGFEYIEGTIPAYKPILKAATRLVEDEIRAAVPAILAIEECLGHLRNDYEHRFHSLDGCGRDDTPLC